MDDQRLQNIINVVAITCFILVTVAACNIEKCSLLQGTLETKNEPYKGKPGVTEPYADEKPKLTIGPGSCDPYTKHCNYFPLARVGIHNPTGSLITAEVHCTFFVGDWNAGKNERQGVKIKPYSTKYVELQQNLDVMAGQGGYIGISCTTTFK